MGAVLRRGGIHGRYGVANATSSTTANTTNAPSSAYASSSANATSAASTDANTSTSADSANAHSTRPNVRTAHEGVSKLASHFEEVLRGFPERLRELLRHHSWLRGCEHRRTQLLRWFLLRWTGGLLLWLVRLPRQRQRDHRMTHVPLQSGQVLYPDRMESMRDASCDLSAWSRQVIEYN